MLAITFGILFILGGIVWFVMTASGAGMASRHTTAWESLGVPLLGLIPAGLGIAMLIWG